jgi:hypothetical protein
MYQCDGYYPRITKEENDMSRGRKPLDVSLASLDQKTKILAYASEVRKFEIERFWQRSVLFWGVVAAAFIAYGQLYGKDELSLFVACFGLVCSIAWTLQNRGSKYWQEAWEAKVESVELDVLGAHLFRNREPLKRRGLWGPRMFSVSRLAIALSDFTVLVWLALACKVFPFTHPFVAHGQSAIAASFTVIYIFFLFTCRQMEGRSSSH